jgi:adenylate cyclase
MTRLRDLVRFEVARRAQLPGWIERLISAGIVTSDPQVLRRQRITNVAALAGGLNASSRFVANLFYDAEHFLLMQTIFGCLALTAFLIHRLHRFGENVAAVTLTIWFLAGVTSSSIFYGLQAQAQVYFVLGAILWFTFGLENWRLAIGGLLLVCAVMLAVIHFVPQEGIALSHDQVAVKFLAMQSIINALIINAAVLFYALFVLRRTEMELEGERTRAETLVSVVMPDQVAERLRSGKETRIADRIDGVSVLFSDLANFTPAAHAAAPEAVVDYLDEYVRTLDLMCETYGVDKIKTIGDSYMAVGGLHGSSREAAIAIGELALEVLKVHGRRPTLAGRKLGLRIGIHYGTAIAGVIGESRISYDVWGDAVNIASRMESHGLPGRIQVSEEFKRVTEHAFAFEERGTTEIKGIGATCTFFLIGPRTPA